MSSLSDVRTAITDQLAEALPHFQVYRAPVDSITAPALIVAGFTSDEDATLDGNQQWTVEVFAAVSRRHIDEMDVLDEVVSRSGDGSAWVALDADPTLGGVVDWLNVAGVGSYRELQYGDVGYFAVTLRVEVTF